MRIWMEYKIISGRTMETRRSLFGVRAPGQVQGQRAPRKAGSSSAKKIAANEREEKKRLARSLNCNFSRQDFFITRKYSDEIRPENYGEAEKTIARDLAKARKKFKALTGRTPRVIWVTANWSPKRKAPARLHHHLVVEPEMAKILCQMWEGDKCYSLEHLRDQGDYSNLAAYMLDNVHGRPGGQRYHSSRNLDKPIYTEPVPVEDAEGIQPHKGAVIQDHEQSLDEEGRVIGTYLREVLPEPPKVRGGQIVLPRPPKRGGKKHGGG